MSSTGANASRGSFLVAFNGYPDSVLTNVQGIHGLQGDGSVDAAIIGYVRFLGGSNERIQNVVNLHRDHIACIVVQKPGDIETETGVTAYVPARVMAVDPNVSDLKSPLELQPETAITLPLLQREGLPVPSNAAEMPRCNERVVGRGVPGVRQPNLRPGGIIVVRLVGAREFRFRGAPRGGLASEPPALIQGNLEAKRRARSLLGTWRTGWQARIKRIERNRRCRTGCGRLHESTTRDLSGAHA